MSKDKLTPRQEKFVYLLFEGTNQRKAYVEAGYSPKGSLATIDRNASALANDTKVLTRLAELRKVRHDKAFMTVEEREERLSEIGRARITDFLDGDGDPDITKEAPNKGAIAKYSRTVRYTKKGEAIVTRTIELRDPVSGIQELNKMDKVYTEPEKKNVELNQAFIFVMPDGTQLTPRQLVDGSNNSGKPSS